MIGLWRWFRLWPAWLGKNVVLDDNTDDLLQESGDFLLQENGDKINL